MSFVGEARILSSDQSPVAREHDDGTVTLEWPNGRGAPFLVAPEALERLIEERNRFRLQASAASVGGSPSSETVAAVLDETAGHWEPMKGTDSVCSWVPDHEPPVEELFGPDNDSPVGIYVRGLRAEVEALKAELVRTGAALWMDPARQGGSICFMGSRTPIDCCIGYGSIEGFCDDYGFTRRQALVAVAYWTLEMEHRSKADRKTQRDLRAWANVAFWDLARDLDPEAPTVESPPAALLGGQQ